MSGCIQYKANKLRRFICIAAVSASLAACTSAETPKIEAEAAGFGVLSTDEVDNEDNPLLLEQTQQIPMKEGTSFGLQFYTKPSSEKDQKTKLRFIWHFPAPGLQDPSKSEPLQNYEQIWHVQVGKKTTASYLLEQPWELAPGKWRVEIWQEDKKLLTQSFDLSQSIP